MLNDDEEIILDPEEQIRLDEQNKQLRRLKRLIYIDDFKWLMSTKNGRRVMWGLLEKCGPLQSPYRGESTHDTAFFCGYKAYGTELLAEIHEYAFDRYVEMIKEAKDGIRKLRAKADRAATGDDTPDV